MLDQYRFHMTLTGPVPGAQREDTLGHLVHTYKGLAGDESEIDAISVMRQDDPAARFRVLDRFFLAGRDASAEISLSRPRTDTRRRCDPE